MKTVITFAISFIIIMLTLSGCSGFSIMSYEENEPDLIKKSHSFSNEIEDRSIVVAEGETCVVSFDIVTNGGIINISIKDSGDVSYYSENDIPTSNFEATLDKQGEYTLIIETIKHSGSYDIKWNSSK